MLNVSAADIQDLKITVMSLTGLSKDALHVYVGLIVFLGAALILRRPAGSPLPWLAAFVAALLGEVVDARGDLTSLGYWRWLDSMRDVVNTIFWPTLLVLAARLTPVFDETA